jgi:hypothetical protein
MPNEGLECHIAEKAKGMHYRVDLDEKHVVSIHVDGKTLTRINTEDEQLKLTFACSRGEKCGIARQAKDKDGKIVYSCPTPNWKNQSLEPIIVSV